ncbi:centrosomal protein of 68 kDa isoform X2 [Eublepharis macularius]|uniref:Centrosomal protein of 68 kDa isoform X2 n=1 Tax=Eublepharis macularius TaxID=481883 RepID=A0AA97L1T2_EUBMA|nr:centrosomal protein of 68 kDa isoform X2 [Eublepharis macularius]
MALDAKKSPLDAPLSVKAKRYGRWNNGEIERDYSELVGKVCQLSNAEDEKPLPQGTEGEEPGAVEGATSKLPTLSPRNPKHHQVSLISCNRFCKRKARYVERKPLVSKTTCISEVLPRFNRVGLFPKDQQITAECSNSAELLQSAAEPPAVLPCSTMDSKLYSPSIESLHNLDADCKSQTAFNYSSTPKALLSKRISCFDASTPLFSKTSLSLETSEDGDCELHNQTRSKSFSAAGAVPSWHLHRLSDSKETSITGTPKQITVDCRSPAGQVRQMSSFQADYWACAIPDSLPPSPDRQSPHWNPNKEYEDLLDYTYPIRPKYKLAKNLKYGMRESSIHDSGIDLDSLSVSPESTLKSTSVPGQEHQAMGVQSAQRFQTPLLKKSERSAPVSHYRLSPVGKVSFADVSPSIGRTIFSRDLEQSFSPRCSGPCSSDSTNIRKQSCNMREYNDATKNTSKHDCIVRRDAAGSFIRSTRMLPLQNVCCSDEEYLPLPPRLKELEVLAQQLTDLSLTMKPGRDHLESSFPSLGVNGEYIPPEVRGSDERQWEIDCDSCCTGSSQEDLSNQSCKDCLNTERVSGNAGARDFVGMECMETGSDHQKEEEAHRGDSLAQRIKVFCCQLEELIHWLHKIAEVTDNWIPPKPDVESVKASLQSYLALKKDLASHQVLTESVLQDGERLLKSIASNSPVLQHTLRLIAKQSIELESNADCLYESILGALDALDAGLRKSCDVRQPAGQTEASKRVTETT